MKTVLYLIRHGQSEANSKKIFTGTTDYPLTERGHNQAELTALYLSKIGAGKIYSSDLKRAYETALHTAKLLNMNIKKDEKLREIFAGEWENKSFDLIENKYKDSYAIWFSDIDNAIPDSGESVLKMKERIVKEITKIAENNSGKTVFIFTHATPIRAFCSFCEKKRMRDIPWPTNSSVSSFLYEDGEFMLKDYSVDYFMGDLRTKLPVNV